MENVTILPAKHTWEDFAEIVTDYTFLHVALIIHLTRKSGLPRHGKMANGRIG
jgi:hypothetical protein